ncbi:TetR/AcrR family transcriptional regulator [uncultured Sphingomonas sp.]|uniref:TetR/AcrR family transcriptional regulator n=1 Tax=uncultured Sphingomonas sp. TaxID=158754 RepID=UPI0035CC11AE
MTNLVQPSLRTAQREVVRSRILAAARAAFIETGIAETSIDDIATRAGLARATLYRHFTGREGLLLGMLDEDWDRQVKLYARVPPAAVLDAQTARAWLRRLLHATQARRDSLRLYATMIGRGADMIGRLARQRQRLVDALGEQLSVFADQDPRLRIEAMLTVMEIEQYCVYAGGEVTPAETEIATDIVADHFLAFCGKK